MMQYDDRVISISEIDSEDDTCCLGLHTDTGLLCASIKALGLINPPVLRKKHNLKYQVVCGFRRVKACRLLGWHELKGRVLVGDPSELDLIKLAILDNRSHRQLNVVEQARGIQKLGTLIFPAQDRLKVLSSLLGFPPNQKVFGKLSRLSLTAESIQAGVLDGTISFEAASLLGEFCPEDALCFFDLFKGLRLSQNKQTQIITLVQEIGIREDLEPTEVISSKEVSSIMDRADLNRNEKASALRAYLKRRRLPTLSDAEDRFREQLRALKLNEHTHITPPPCFEGGPYTLRMSFKSIKEFDKCRNCLDAMAKNPAMKKLLEPFE